MLRTTPMSSTKILVSRTCARALREPVAVHGHQPVRTAELGAVLEQRGIGLLRVEEDEQNPGCVAAELLVHDPVPQRPFLARHAGCGDEPRIVSRPRRPAALTTAPSAVVSLKPGNVSPTRAGTPCAATVVDCDAPGVDRCTANTASPTTATTATVASAASHSCRLRARAGVDEPAEVRRGGRPGRSVLVIVGLPCVGRPRTSPAWQDASIRLSGCMVSVDPAR